MNDRYVTYPSLRKYGTKKHIICINTKICNKFGSMPNIECAKANCEYARLNEYICDITPIEFCHKMNYRRSDI